MSFKVRFTDSAERDLEGIYEYISAHDSFDKAIYVIDKIETRIEKLTESPERGSVVKELSVLGIQDYREIYFKPYRIIYKDIGDTVFVMLVVDGRRDMQTVLQRRLLE